MKLKGLSIIAILCTILIIWVNFIDFKFAEIIPGKGEKFEYLIEALSISYLAAYIFYFLNIHLVEKRERKAILPFVGHNVLMIIVNNHSIINCLKNDNKLSKNYYPSKEEYKVLLKNINPKDKAPFYYKNENWLYLLNNRNKSTKKSIDKILLSGKHLDEELRRLLLDIYFSLYLDNNYGFNLPDFDKQNLEDSHLVFFKYFDLVERLNIYYEKNLKKYYLMTTPNYKK
jgi:hypothetical protein